MRLNERLFWLSVAALPALVVSSPLAAQTAELGPVRTVLALGRVSSMVAAPMYFKLLRVTIPSGATTVYRGDQSTIYLLSGAVVVTNGNDKRTLKEGEGTHIAGDTSLTLHAGGNVPAVILRYQLSPAANLSNPAETPPASVIELHRMAIPAVALKPGPYEFSMTRVTVPAGAPRPRPHTRSGAALYYVLAEGAITYWPSATVEAILGESRTDPRTTGAIQEEPNGFIHSWQSKLNSPLVLLQANVSQEGLPEIIFIK